MKEDLPISKCRKIGYSLAGLGSTMIGIFMGVYFTAFLLEVAKVGPSFVAIIMLSGNVVKAFSDPIIGYLVSQSPQTRYGKFLPWMLVSLPIYCVLSCFVWFVPMESTTLKMVYYIIVYCFVNVSNACFNISYNSCVISMSSCQRERDSLVVGRVICGAFGSVCATMTFAVFSYLGNINDWNKKTAYFFTGLVAAGVTLVAGFVSFMSIEERFTLNHGRGKWGPILKPYFNVLKFKPYSILLCSVSFSYLAYQTAISNFPLFFKYVLDAENIYPLCITCITISSALSLFFWKVLTVKIGKKTCLILGTLLAIIIFWSLLFIKYNLILILVVCILLGLIGGCCVSLVVHTMVPDVIAAYNLQNGHGDEAMFYSIIFFIETVSWAVCSALSSLALEAAGYQSVNSIQPAGVGLALRLIIGVFSVICSLIALISALEYPITEKARVKMHSVIKRSMSTLYTKA